ncbi:HEPN domain-containing protein [Thermococcus sp. LS2]|uniref:ApeA N-terminal domain 1-containing protein n=1 Tax=Thermococcus sp. LS2 TaxID=1638260 RepID=UPI0014393FC9|nr:HEPN domain-containing protein [Thermococcus sp. LS2]NJE11887.1 hypothetical protein [Thermococcus sp. LS2]
MSDLEYKGVWWLPDRPEVKVPGTLKLTPNRGAVLDLLGYFKDIRDIKNIMNLSHHEIILGKTSDGRDITLHKCIETNKTLRFPGFSTSSFYVENIFVGAHFFEEEDLKFKKLLVRYRYLDEWANISGFQFQYGELRETEFVIRYKCPDPINVRLDEDWIISLEFQTKYPTYSIVQKEACISQMTYVGIASSDKRSFNEYLKMVSLIQDFLSLGVGKSVYPLTTIGITIEGTKVEVFYPIVGAHNTTADTVVPPKMPFTFKDISSRFEVVLRNWFKKAELLEPVYNLYFGTLHNPHTYLEHQFLSMVQAVESYHRRVYDGKYLPEEEYEELYKVLVGAIPDDTKRDLKERLKAYLKYGNEFSLRKRLKQIINQYKDILDEYLEDRNKFIEDVVITRNYLTHYDKELKERAAKDVELYYLTQKLRLLVMICLLAELGFDSNEIKNIVQRSAEYLNIRPNPTKQKH